MPFNDHATGGLGRCWLVMRVEMVGATVCQSVGAFTTAAFYSPKKSTIFAIADGTALGFVTWNFTSVRHHSAEAPTKPMRILIRNDRTTHILVSLPPRPSSPHLSVHQHAHTHSRTCTTPQHTTRTHQPTNLPIHHTHPLQSLAGGHIYCFAGL